MDPYSSDIELMNFDSYNNQSGNSGRTCSQSSTFDDSEQLHNVRPGKNIFEIERNVTRKQPRLPNIMSAKQKGEFVLKCRKNKQKLNRYKQLKLVRSHKRQAAKNRPNSNQNTEQIIQCKDSRSVNIKKLRNRQSAQISRDKKKRIFQGLLKKVEDVEAENRHLKQIIASMQLAQFSLDNQNQNQQQQFQYNSYAPFETELLLEQSTLSFLGGKEDCNPLNLIPLAKMYTPKLTPSQSMFNTSNNNNSNNNHHHQQSQIGRIGWSGLSLFAITCLLCTVMHLNTQSQQQQQTDKNNRRLLKKDDENDENTFYNKQLNSTLTNHSNGNDYQYEFGMAIQLKNQRNTTNFSIAQNQNQIYSEESSSQLQPMSYPYHQKRTLRKPLRQKMLLGEIVESMIQQNLTEETINNNLTFLTHAEGVIGNKIQEGVILCGKVQEWIAQHMPNPMGKLKQKIFLIGEFFTKSDGGNANGNGSFLPNKIKELNDYQNKTLTTFNVESQSLADSNSNNDSNQLQLNYNIQSNRQFKDFRGFR